MFVRSLTLGVAAAALMAGTATAADLFVPTTPPPVFVSEPSIGWEGLYVGVQGGGLFAEQNGTNQTYGVIGGVVGANFIPADPILVGLELQGDYIWGNGQDAGLFLALARVGAIVTDEVLVYATGGVGSIFAAGDSEMVYALGAGVEFAVAENVSVRGEVLGLGDFDQGAGPWVSNGDFFGGAKATVGVFYRF